MRTLSGLQIAKVSACMFPASHTQMVGQSKGEHENMENASYHECIKISKISTAYK